MARISVTIYRNSKLASVISIMGSSFLLGGLYGTIAGIFYLTLDYFISGLIFMGIGAYLIVWARKISRKKQLKRNIEMLAENALQKKLHTQERMKSLVSGKLMLFVEQDQKEIEFQKNQIIVGRHFDCDLQFSNSRLSRIHAMFLYDGFTWLLQDCSSTNGTWLNGNKLKPGEKYSLAPDDRIEFANAITVIFFKSASTDNAVKL